MFFFCLHFTKDREVKHSIDIFSTTVALFADSKENLYFLFSKRNLLNLPRLRTNSLRKQNSEHKVSWPRNVNDDMQLVGHSGFVSSRPTILFRSCSEMNTICNFLAASLQSRTCYFLLNKNASFFNLHIYWQLERHCQRKVQNLLFALSEFVKRFSFFKKK